MATAPKLDEQRFRPRHAPRRRVRPDDVEDVPGDRRLTVSVSPLDRLAEEWRQDVERLREYGADAQARAVERCVEKLEQARAERDLQTLTLREAAEVSGYSYSRLQELVGEKIPNVGEEGAPRVRRGDLPRKPGRTSAEVAVEETEDGEPDLAAARLELADG